MRAFTLGFLLAITALTAWASDPRLEPFIPKQDKQVVIRHDRMDLVFDVETLTPVWSAHRLDPAEIVEHKANRAGMTFRPDPLVAKSPRASNYAKQAPWVLGHMTPADDFDFDQELMRQTFFTSNVVPQDDKDNISAWKILEMKVRKVCAEGRELVVVCGPRYDKSVKTIGPEAVGIPVQLWKLVIDPKAKEAAAFLYDNDPSSRSIAQARISLSEFKQLTGRAFIADTYTDGGSLLKELTK